MLVRLVYVSTILKKQCSSEEIEDILKSAQTFNNKNHVTGILCFNRKYFLQCLEGSAEQVNTTYNRIVKDPRHEKLMIIEYKNIAARRFANWSMGFVPISESTDSINLQFSATPDFEPYQMSAESVYELLTTLKESIVSEIN